MSGNHNQSLENALAIVKAAAMSGCDAVKLQTYTADTMTLNIDSAGFQIQENDSIWAGEKLYDLYSQAYTPWEWHERIIGEAKKEGIICFSTPFDETAVDFLESLNVPAYKIASFENTHIPLIKKVAKTGKPIIISTGMATLGELETAVKVVRQEGCNDIILLKCTSSYPAPESEANVRTIPHLLETFNCQVGLSDHTRGIGVALAAVSHGATVVEKHFTLNRNDGGTDAEFSMEPGEMKNLVIEAKRAHKALGRINYGTTDADRSSIKYRRSIYICEDISEGEIFSKKNLKIIRPGLGAPPIMIDHVIGKYAKRSFKRGEPLRIEDLF